MVSVRFVVCICGAIVVFDGVGDVVVVVVVLVDVVVEEIVVDVDGMTKGFSERPVTVVVAVVLVVVSVVLINGEVEGNAPSGTFGVLLVAPSNVSLPPA